jgi:acyl-CoA synthetase (AMP-forming)/AMP-acid ligase II
VAYGSSEAEPIAAIDAAEVERETTDLTAAGRGHCVGPPIPPTELRIERAGREGIGEIAVRGPHVNAAGWHRTGDTGYRDARGRVWLLGREADRVQRSGGDIHPYAVEPVVEALPFVGRCAIVGVADDHLGERAVLVVSARGRSPLAALIHRRAWRRRLALLLSARGIAIDEIRWARRLPLEHRHHAKIRHAELRRQIARAARR